MVMCLAMALCGFLSFGSKTQGNVLNNFPADNILVNIARLYAPIQPPDNDMCACFAKVMTDRLRFFIDVSA